ncbi:hypothetical protein K438DRAFT_1966548 [Mycena galopus ATCC 62051]|nr:hypothetical protein K438DRAFT_1966548 [Mycena galopus ATCC 62051]
MFEEAADLSQGEIKAYRTFVFPDALADPGHDPFFSVENAPHWVTSHGFQLYLTYKDSAITTSLWTPDNASVTQLKAYQCYILGKDYMGHPYFSLETPEAWINPQLFEAYMSITHGPFEDYLPVPPREPHPRWLDLEPAAVSPFCHLPEQAHRLLSPLRTRCLVRQVPCPDMLPFAPAHIPETKALDGLHTTESTKSRGKGKGKASVGKISITRQQKVDEIIDTSTVKSTWTVPHTPIAVRVDISQCMEKLTLLATITGGEALRAEREDGNTEHKQSIVRQKILEGEIKALQEALKLDKRRTDVKLDINALRKDVAEEKNGRREWVTRRADIDIQLEELRSGPLAGTRLNGRRPAERPTGDPEHSGEPTVDTSLGNEVVRVGPSTGLLTFFLAPVQSD